MATLRFNYGTMGSGKSTLALQINHNLTSRGLAGLLLTKLDRDGGQVTSRLGVSTPAIEMAPEIDLDTQFDKCILSPINSIIEPLGLPLITKRLSVVLDIFSGF